MKLLVLFASTCLSISAYAQNLRVHVGAGMANYYGDIQPTRFNFNQAKGMFSLGASYDITNKIALRVDYSKAHLGASDAKTNIKSYVGRNLSFETGISEFSLLVEYNIFNYLDRPLTPYVFAGVGYFKFNPYTYDSLSRQIMLQPLSTEGQGLPDYPDRQVYKLAQMNIPFGAGFKYYINDGIFLGFEMGIRKLFTDYLDDVSTTYVDPAALQKWKGPLAVSLAFRGDEAPFNNRYPRVGQIRGGKEKDWYYFAQLRASFRLNWGSGGYYSGARRGLGCPRAF